MEKNRIRPIKSGKNSRMSYSRQKEVLQMPNLIEVQKDSYQWFLDEGLKEVFDDISPITDYSGHLSHLVRERRKVLDRGVQGAGRHLCCSAEGARKTS